MNTEFLRYFDEHLIKNARIENNIPRFTPEISYSSGNFSRLREKHATLQLDSINGTTDRRDTLLGRTNWPASFFDGKTVLECGCGAGPDTEILLSLGAKVVAVDIAGVDVAKKNLGNNPNLQIIQASITDLPLKKHSFDIVYCHRVLQHTPEPPETLRHILQYVKDDGAAFVHSYAHTFYQMFRWKYFLLPFTRRMDPEKLYNFISWYAPKLVKVTSVISRFGKYGNYFNWVFMPVFDYTRLVKYKGRPKDFILEYSVHDTFDALSPRYDKPIKLEVMRSIAKEFLKQPFEIFEGKGITLLRTVVK